MWKKATAPEKPISIQHISSSSLDIFALEPILVNLKSDFALAPNNSLTQEEEYWKAKAKRLPSSAVLPGQRRPRWESLQQGLTTLLIMTTNTRGYLNVVSFR